MATRHAASYGEHTSHRATNSSIPGLIYCVIMSSIWAGVLVLAAPLLFR